mmetsp:Transcript_129969/g.363797  ORF Transcript_129969/g.363797 Transcript_129969/m.363797 type:complete len:186 (+) Transcript_129969:158-715(+)
MRFVVAVAFLLVASATAYTPAPMNRRDAFKTVVASGAAVLVTTPTIVNALEACPKGSSNCIRTEWTPPAGSSKDAAIASLKKALDSYPQEGQQKVDLGGWAIVDDFSDGSARVEFKSGIGNFAKFLNGGKPFVDDLKFEVADSGVVSVKSSSRVGDSDFGVNQKRLQFLVSKLREDGWTAPDPAY